MKLNFIKYAIKFSSVLVLSGFLYSNLSIYKFVTGNCTIEETSCCCSHENETGITKYSKACCCEIKEIPENQTEATLNTIDFTNKNFCQDYKYIIKSTDYSNQTLSGFLISTNSGLHGRDILIINSILRI